MLVWFLLAIVAIANGVVRQSTYGKILPSLAAHQVSTLTAIIASGTLVWFINGAWPIETSTQAWTIGAIWLVSTIAFEFGFGHWVAGHSWEVLLADYNLMKGRVWSLFLLWIAVLPWTVFYFTSLISIQ